MLKEFISKKSVGFYLFAASAIFALAMLITYACRGGDVLTKIEPAAIVVLIVGIVLNVLLAVKTIRPLEIIPYLCYFVALVIFFASEITFMGNLAFGVDGNRLDAGFVFVAVFGAIAFVSGMASSMMKFEKE